MEYGTIPHAYERHASPRRSLATSLALRGVRMAGAALVLAELALLAIEDALTAGPPPPARCACCSAVLDEGPWCHWCEPEVGA